MQDQDSNRLNSFQRPSTSSLKLKEKAVEGQSENRKVHDKKDLHSHEGGEYLSENIDPDYKGETCSQTATNEDFERLLSILIPPYCQRSLSLDFTRPATRNNVTHAPADSSCKKSQLLEQQLHTQQLTNVASSLPRGATSIEDDIQSLMPTSIANDENYEWQNESYMSVWSQLWDNAVESSSSNGAMINGSTTSSNTIMFVQCGQFEVATTSDFLETDKLIEPLVRYLHAMNYNAVFADTKIRILSFRLSFILALEPFFLRLE